MKIEANPSPEQLRLLLVIVLIVMGYHHETILSVVG